MPTRTALLRLLSQSLLVATLVLLLGWLGHNVLENMRARGIQAGFDFLLEPAGFEIGESLFDYDASQPLWRAFLTGTGNTLRVALPAILISTLLGSLIGLGRLAAHPVPRRLCGALVETLRNVPLLLQLLMCYFALTSLLPEAADAISPLPWTLLGKGGFFMPAWRCGESGCSWDLPVTEGFGISGGWSLSPEFLAMLIALSLYSAVFIAEIVRGGIRSVPRGQIDAARAIGLRPLQVLRYVTAPLALRAIVPPLGNQYLNLIKNSSLAVAVGYPELVSVSNTSLNQTGRAFECIVIVMAVYLALSLLTALLVNLYNRHVALRGVS